MADRGIIFSSPMILALLDGRKRQTRRLIKGLGDDIDNVCDCESVIDLATGAVVRMPHAEGDRLYVRETCKAEEIEPSGQDGVRMLADDAWLPIENSPGCAIKWLKLFTYGSSAKRGERRGEIVPCIYMPRWASRLWLAVEDVRLERLRDITEDDAVAEGVMNTRLADGRCLWNPHLVGGYPINSARHAYSELWDSLHHGDGTRWADNPWIVRTAFDVHKGNIDAELQSRT